MHACILSNQHDQALQVFRTLTEGHTPLLSEFYPGGEEHQISPLCRDLAMRAFENSMQESGSIQAVNLLKQTVESERTVSFEALCGVLSACERDKNWEDAVDIFFRYISEKSNLCVVGGSSLQIPTVDDYIEQNTIGRSIVGCGRMLASVMRTCNAANQSGVSLLCFILADKSLPSLPVYTEKAPTLPDYVDLSGSIEQTMLPILLRVENMDEVLAATMVALSGVHCTDEGLNLVKTITANKGQSTDMYDSESLSIFLKENKSFSSSGKQRQWYSSHKHFHRICTALQAIMTKGELLEATQRRTLSSALAAAMRSSTLAGHPVAGLLLAEYVRSQLSGLAASKQDGSLFGWPTKSQPSDGLIWNDNLLAGQMSALQATNQSDLAISLFESVVNGESEYSSQWSESCSVTLDILVQNADHDKVEKLLPQLIRSNENIEFFAAAAATYARANRWKEVADLYHIAVEKGILSASLAVLAMKAVVETNIPGRLKALRGIIDDASHAAGQTPMMWLEQNYWRIKPLLGFAHTRLLMWWNDPNTSHLDELQFALEVFEDRRRKGLQAKNATLRLIVANARLFREGSLPPEKREITRIPRDKSSWLELLQDVYRESENLENDTSFVDDYATALYNLDSHADCVAFVKAALRRKIRLRQNTLSAGLHAAEVAEMLDEAGDIQLALSPDYQPR